MIPKGYRHSKETKRKMSESHLKLEKTGDKSHAWKSGKIITTCGYARIYKPEHPFADTSGYVAEHRLVMEDAVDRYLESDEVVHHIDYNVTNNKLSNLILFKNRRDHIKYHKKLRANEILGKESDG